MKIHLGCGGRRLEGFTNIDVQAPGADMHVDVRDLPFDDGTVDEIYASHVLEHFGRHEYKAVLKEWRRVLRVGGKIYISVPDIESSFAHYARHGDLAALYGALWGGQRDEYDYHKIGFNFQTLDAALTEAGFTATERYDTFKYLPDNFDDYSKAFLPHMDFSGQQMSLNVCSTAA